MSDFAILESPILISRKIWVVEKSWNFHTVRAGPYEKQSAIIFVVSIYVQMSTVKFDKVGLVFFKANRSYRTKHNVNTCHSGGRMSTNR